MSGGRLLVAIVMLIGCGDRSPPALWPEPPPPTLAHPIGVDLEAQAKTKEPDLAEPAEPDEAEPAPPDATTGLATDAAATAPSEPADEPPAEPARAPPKAKRKAATSGGKETAERAAAAQSPGREPR